MHPINRPVSLLVRVGTWALHLYLCLLLTGCGAHRSALITFGKPAQQPIATTSTAPSHQVTADQAKPAQSKKSKKSKKPPAPAPVEETHLFLGDERAAYESCVALLRDAGYDIDEADPEEGVILGSLSTNEPQGVIVDANHPAPKPVPGWQAPVTVLAGAAMLVGGILAVTDGLLGNHSEQVAEDRVGAGLALMGFATNIEPATPSRYEYQIAIQLLPMEGKTTQVRVLMDGTETQEEEVLRSGPVQASEFLTRFYAALDQSTHAEPHELQQHALSVR